MRDFYGRLKRVEAQITRPRFGGFWRIERRLAAFLKANHEADVAGRPRPERPPLSTELAARVARYRLRFAERSQR